MDEQELRELDAWLAEHVFGWSHLNETALGALIGHNPKTGLPCDVPKWTKKDFAEVKREIERRGWEWRSEVKLWISSYRFVFQIFGAPTEEEYGGFYHEMIGFAHAATEESAGCLALKKAIERVGEE